MSSNDTTAKNADIHAYGELEKYMYGGNGSFSYFNWDMRKCNSFSQTPVLLERSNGTANFGYTWSLVVNNNDGDYLSNTWVSLKIPEVRLREESPYRVRWTENLMHNIIEEITLTFNDVVVSKLDNFALDFLSEFNLDNNRYHGYMKGIGNVDDLVVPSKTLKSRLLFLPIPLFFCKDSGNAVPLTALPHTEIRINIRFRIWENLLMLIDENNDITGAPLLGRDIDTVPNIEDAKLYCTFITVSDEERSKIGVLPRTLVIDQIQTSPRQMVYPDTNTRINLLFKQSVKSLFFAIRNTTYKNVWSKYTHSREDHNDNEIITTASIKYNDKSRVIKMPADYYHRINPFYHNKRVPDKPGIYTYNFSLNLDSPDPCGGAPLSKVDNPTLCLELTDDIKTLDENYELVVVALTNNVVKISEGLLTFPVV